MIREGKKIPDDAIQRLPNLIDEITQDSSIVALFAFGSLVEDKLKPLSDLDFGVLLTKEMNRSERFDKHLELIGIFNRIFSTDEIDLVIMNDTPPRFSYNIIRKGKLLFLRDEKMLDDFREAIIKTYLDFKYFRDEFDKAFLEGIGYYG